jgi:hypothetical protein
MRDHPKAGSSKGICWARGEVGDHALLLPAAPRRRLPGGAGRVDGVKTR